MNVVERHFALKAPCNNCPFRKEGGIVLAPGRLEGIIKTITDTDMSTFHCHKVVHSKIGGEWDDEGNYTASQKEAMCAGAIIYLEKLGRPTVPMRLAHSMGVYHPETLLPHYNMIIDPKESHAKNNTQRGGPKARPPD